jgi:hypothetical protein
MNVIRRSVPILLVCSIPLFAQTKSAAPVAPKNPSAAEETHSSAALSGTNLPVRRVVLYKNGVGFFEHLGAVHGNQDVHIDFTSAQLNDVLNSLTVLDLSGGHITGVDYNSEAPLARRLATLRLALGEKPTQAEFLGALRGARMEVRNGMAPAITGKLLSVERKTRSSTNFTVETEEISLISDEGEVRSADLNPTTSIRILDSDLKLEVGRYLVLIASSRDQDVRRMTLSTAGTGDRNLYASYISEVPIWKTTYRIVLPTRAEKKPLLQGWAIVDNTVGEDWNNVELSLVAGAPHSFIQQLSEPYYGRRPVVPLPESVQLSPQTHAAALSGGNGRLSGMVTDATGAAVAGASVRLLDENGTPVATTVTDNSGNYSFSTLAVGNYRLEAQQRGFKTSEINGVTVSPGENQMNSTLQVGSISESIMVTAAAQTVDTSSAEITASGTSLPGVANRPHVGTESGGGYFMAKAPPPPTPPPPSAANLDAARELSSTAANGQELGDLFEYKLKDRVTLRKNQSALVPIAQTNIEAEKVSLWSNTNGSGRPLRALWIKNTSNQTLDSGSFSVLENEVFAGEGLTDSIKPGERRLVSFATDLGLVVEARQTSQPQHVTHVRIAKGMMTQLCEVHERTLYGVRSQDDSARTLVIEHPARFGSTLAKGTVEPEETAPGMYRFKLQVPAKGTASLPVEEVRVLQTNFQLTSVDEDQIALFIKNGTVTPAMADALKKIAAQKATVNKPETDMDDRQKAIDRIVADQARPRENMKALKGNAEEKALLQRYTRELDEQETQLDSLRKTIQSTEAERDKANVVLDDMIANLDLDASI